MLTLSTEFVFLLVVRLVIIDNFIYYSLALFFKVRLLLLLGIKFTFGISGLFDFKAIDFIKSIGLHDFHELLILIFIRIIIGLIIG